MGNCLLTKLKENVSNDNLVKIGNFRINVKATTIPAGQEPNMQVLVLAFNNYGGTTKMTVAKGNGHIGFAQDDITHTELIINGTDRKSVWFENVNMEVEVENKYKISRISGNSLFSANPIASVNVDDFKFVNTQIERLSLRGVNNTGNIESINAQAIALQNTSIRGDIECLRGKALTGIEGYFQLSNNKDLYGEISALNSINARSIDIQSSGISGDISAFVNPNINRIEARYSKVQGTVEGFAAAMKAVKSTGSVVTCNFVGTGVTYQGNPVGSELRITFTNEEPTIEVVV